MTRSRIFLILSLSFIGGIFWRSFLSDNYSVYYFLIPAAAVVAVFYRQKIVVVSFFAACAFAVGFWLTNRELRVAENQNLDGKHFSENVWVSKEPQIKENYQHITVKTASGLSLLLTANLYEKVGYGDGLVLECTLKIPENRKGGFDYRMYLAKDQVYYLCEDSFFEKNGMRGGNSFYRGLLTFKNNMKEHISEVIPEPEAALAQGIIFGGSSQLSKSMADTFSRTGLSHIVAVSGFNVTIIAEYLMAIGIFIGLWRKQAFWLSVVGIVLFVASVGFPSSAVRAGVMGSLLLWAMKNGRLAHSRNAIVFAGATMLVLNPLLLKWDIGFQLSFLATLGIVECSPLWERLLIRKNKMLSKSEELLFLTMSATVFVLPIIMYNFHTLSLISLISNFLVLPVIPLAMLLVFLTAAMSLIGAPLAVPFAWVAFLPLKYIIEVVEFLGNISWSSVEVKTFGISWLVGWYVMLLGGMYLLKMKLRKAQKI